MTQPQKQLRKLKITDEEVTISFAEVLANAPMEAEDLEDESEAAALANLFQVKSKFKPHKDLTDSMKKLRKFALEICEMTVDGKEIPNWNVTGLKIDGDLLMRQSRAVLTLSKSVKRTKKVISFNTPQTTMYGESEYHNAEKMAAIIEDIVEECWSYLNGKYETEGQLPLFNRAEVNPLKVTRKLSQAQIGLGKKNPQITA